MFTSRGLCDVADDGQLGVPVVLLVPVNDVSLYHFNGWCILDNTTLQWKVEVLSWSHLKLCHFSHKIRNKYTHRRSSNLDFTTYCFSCFAIKSNQSLFHMYSFHWANKREFSIEICY